MQQQVLIDGQRNAVEEIIRGYREDFFDVFQTTFEQAITISGREDVENNEWMTLGLYLDVCQIRLNKLLKCLDRTIER